MSGSPSRSPWDAVVNVTSTYPVLGRLILHQLGADPDEVRGGAEAGQDEAAVVPEVPEAVEPGAGRRCRKAVGELAQRRRPDRALGVDVQVRLRQRAEIGHVGRR
jgi:hypothetical protein